MAVRSQSWPQAQVSASVPIKLPNPLNSFARTFRLRLSAARPGRTSANLQRKASRRPIGG
jgi:hypothetical protein